MSTNELRAKKFANGVRTRVLEYIIQNNGGYMSQACSSAEIFACLFGGIMNLEPVAGPLIPEPFSGVPSDHNKNYVPGYYFNGAHKRYADRFILSPTHYSLVLYAALIEAGRLEEKSMSQFNKDGSTLEQIGAEHSPGMEVMTGSLGQGLSQAVGMALARRSKGETGKTWLIMSDGEFQIGMVWEAFQFMNHYKMDTVGIFVDVNRQQCDGAVNSVMQLGPLGDKLRDFGAEVVKVDGHDIEALYKAAETPHKEKPLVVLCDTDPMRGVPELMINRGKLHYLRMRNEADKERFQLELDKLKGAK
jgi:transketolase